MTNSLQWKKFHPLTDQNSFICLVDSMGDDSSIAQAARVSFGKDEQKLTQEELETAEQKEDGSLWPTEPFVETRAQELKKKDLTDKDRQLIRYLMNHSHTTPFEMVEIKFMVQVPMDCWRQWIRHRTANVNEYSTRYTEALDFFQVTNPAEWRLQATNNKQGSSGYLEDWPNEGEWYGDWNVRDENNLVDGCLLETVQGTTHVPDKHKTPGSFLSSQENLYHKFSKALYNTRLLFGIAKEQARKDLPLSTYTRAYWKCDLHNIFNFLRLRMDSHAQLEIRSFANCMFEIVKQLCPVACEAFEDYVLHSKRFSRMEIAILKQLVTVYENGIAPDEGSYVEKHQADTVAKLSDREWKDFLSKLS